MGDAGRTVAEEYAAQVAKIERLVVRHRAELLHAARKERWPDPPPDQAWCHEIFDEQYHLWRPRGDTVGTASDVLSAIHLFNQQCDARKEERPKSRMYNLIDYRSVIT